MAYEAVLIHDDRYAGWVLGDAHPTQGRRFLNGRDAILATGIGVEMRAPSGRNAREQIESVHAADYVAEVLDHGLCAEWSGQRRDLAELAEAFVAGTLDALDLLARGETLTAVHLPGAKHHAHARHSSGFCVFNDLAIAARTLVGARTAILDIDAHHGDGTEALLREDPRVLTFSTHEDGIFPWTGPFESDAVHHVYNRPVAGGSTDSALLHATEDFIDAATAFAPDFVFVAAGADGHILDPLSNLRYTEESYGLAGARLRAAFPRMPILIGGAGGYRPDDATPSTWAAFVRGVATGIGG